MDITAVTLIGMGIGFVVGWLCPKGPGWAFAAACGFYMWGVYLGTTF